MQRCRPRDKYLAGLWTQSLFTDLLWTVNLSAETTTAEIENPDEGNARPFVSRHASEWRAPTWSWANIEGSVSYHISERDVVKRTYANLVDTTCVSASLGDDTGELLSAEIVLEGRLMPGTVSNRSYTHIFFSVRQYGFLSNKKVVRPPGSFLPYVICTSQTCVDGHYCMGYLV